MPTRVQRMVKKVGGAAGSGVVGLDYRVLSVHLLAETDLLLTCLRRAATVPCGGIASLLTPPGGTGCCSGKRGPWLIERFFCISTSWLRLASAVSILGFRARRGALLTARSRNSLAKVVCTVSPESPPMADSSLALS